MYTAAESLNTISFNDDGTVNIIGSGGAYLRFNASNSLNDYRFRYYKSTTYTDQKAISLYKYTQTNATITGAQVTVDADLSIDYFVSLTNENLIDTDALNLRVTIGEDEPIIISGNKDGDNYVFDFAGITPQRMTDNIKAELC